VAGEGRRIGGSSAGQPFHRMGGMRGWKPAAGGHVEPGYGCLALEGLGTERPSDRVWAPRQPAPLVRGWPRGCRTTSLGAGPGSRSVPGTFHADLRSAENGRGRGPGSWVIHEECPGPSPGAARRGRKGNGGSPTRPAWDTPDRSQQQVGAEDQGQAGGWSPAAAGRRDQLVRVSAPGNCFRAGRQPGGLQGPADQFGPGRGGKPPGSPWDQHGSLDGRRVPGTGGRSDLDGSW